MRNSRFDRQELLFGREGQKSLAACNVAVVGVGGLGTHVVQQLALLGIGSLSLIDAEELADTNRNRYVSAWHDDPVPGSPKVDLGARLANRIDPAIAVEMIHDTLVSDRAFAAVARASHVFGCLDCEGARLVLTELTSAYSRPYFDLATDIIPGGPPDFGGRLCVAMDGQGCLVCRGILDVPEAQLDLLGPAGRRERAQIYGVDKAALNRSGPSVVSINGVLASLGVTEFMVAVTGIRTARPVLTYLGQRGIVAASSEVPAPDCYYCAGIYGRREAADVHRYIRSGVGEHLR